MDKISCEQALHCIERHRLPLGIETLPLAQAVSRVLAEDVFATLDVPLFAQSAMDGFAVRAQDTQEASIDAPIDLVCTATIQAKEHTVLTAVAPNTTQRIFTGAPLPPGANAVVRQEHVSCFRDRVTLFRPVRQAQDVRAKGELLSQGNLIAKAGVRLTPGILGICASQGLVSLPVQSLPKICLLTGGDEIVAPGQPLRPGQLYDTNDTLLGGLLASWGCSARHHIAIRDDPEYLLRKLQELESPKPQLFISVGGVSVGDHDHIITTSRELGFHTVFWGVHQKPGKPLYFARHDNGSLWLGLPGNPHASFVCAHLYLRRLFENHALISRTVWRATSKAAPPPLNQTRLFAACYSDDPGEGDPLDLCESLGAHMRIAKANAMVRQFPNGERSWCFL